MPPSFLVRTLDKWIIFWAENIRVMGLEYSKSYAQLCRFLAAFISVDEDFQCFFWSLEETCRIALEGFSSWNLTFKVYMEVSKESESHL